jgi:GTP-binding protein HflX
VAIVGYTNAGKSTLLNTLTGADVLTEDKLFATLDTRARRLHVGGREIVMTDTVGFIRDLPKDLFSAFRATFEEAADADLILHVVDANDDAKQQHIDTTEALLDELGLAAIPRIVVFNKADLLDTFHGQVIVRAAQARGEDAVLVSATHRETTDALLARVSERLAEGAAGVLSQPS